MIPMTGDFIQIRLRHKRRPGAHIAPFLILQILNPALQLQDHPGSLGRKQRQPLPDHIHCGKEIHLPAQPVVIPALRILHLLQMLRQILLFIISGSIDTLQSCLVGIPSPVGHGRRDELKSLDALCAHQMWARAQIHKLSLTIEGDFRILRKIPDQLHLIGLALFLHENDGLLSGKQKLLQPGTVFDDLLHLRLNGVQILSGKGRMIKVIVKTRVDAGTDGQLCIRKQILYRLRHHMGSRVTDGCQPLRVICRADLQLTVPINHRP